jgi:predicted RNA binding protein YcfA (HicA-like mRNA interferase family)
MGQIEKMLMRVLSGTNDKNMLFADVQKILDRLGFVCRIRGDHFIYTKNNIEEIINIQPLGSKAKAYQVKQIRGIILKYQMGGDIDEI